MRVSKGGLIGRPPKDWPIEEIRRHVEDLGWTHRATGKKLGVNEKYVSTLCKRHGIQSQRRGPRSGPGHPDWEGGLSIRKGYAYVWFPEHPFSTKGGYVLRSHLVMEDKLERYLQPGEVVHHMNNDTLDDDPDNLFLFRSNGLHLKYTRTGKIPNWTEDGIARIRAATQRREANRKALKQCDQEQQGTNSRPED